MKYLLLSSLCAAALLVGGCGNTDSKTSATTPAKIAAEVAPDTIIKSELDKRDYAYKVLPNGMKIVAVSDPSADKAAASLDVHIGHLADPADREGLSHFLEHMLFLGTGKYPKVGEYGEFIKQHGGSKNAGTGQEHTSYFFSIDNAQFEPALDRFSRFFIDPLFDAEFVDKERNAVESEYSLKVKEDARRYREALKQTANPAHPMTQFSVGNLETLSNSDSSTILDAVKAQYETYYSADIMSLAIVGNYPTAQLMEWAEAKFAEVPSRGDTRADKNRPAPYLDSQKGVEIMINVLENDKSVRLEFALPPARQYFKTKPVSYLRNMVTHQGEGTLYDTLKQKGYLKDMFVVTWGPDDIANFNVNFNLTDKGYENADEVIATFFSYVELIKAEGIDESLFDELGRIANQNFKFQDKFNVASFARNLSGNLQYYPPNHILDVGRTFDTFDAKLIRSYLNDITPQNVRVVKTDPAFESDTKEERYDVAYSIAPLPAAKIEAWSKAAPVAGLKLPTPNPFIAEDLTLNTSNIINTPAQAVDKAGLKLWYVNDNEFELPKASLNLRLYSPKVYASDNHKAALPLHTAIIRDMMTTESYAASQAGLYYGVNNSSRSYNITVQGYNDKIDIFLKNVLGKMSADSITEDTFDRIKKNTITNLENQKFGRPISQVFTAVSAETGIDVVSINAQIETLKALEFETFKATVTDLMSAFEVQGLYTGNTTQADTIAIGDMLESQFNSRLKANSKQAYETIFIKPETDIIREVAVDHNDSTIVWMLQGRDESYTEKARFRLLSQILSQRFYKSLRTEQQYGYVVGLMEYSIDETPTLTAYIQSPKAHPSILRDKIQEFYAAQTDYLTSMTEEDFQSHVDGLLSTINKTFDNVYAQGNTLHSDLVAERYKFDNRAQLTAAVKALSREDIAAFYASEILAPTRRSMTLWNIGKAHKGEAAYSAANYNICDTAKCVASALDK